MARGIHRLTARAVTALAKPGRHADGGNLYLQISPTGSRQWTFMFEREGKQREMGLGSAGPGGVSLADAREKAVGRPVVILPRALILLRPAMANWLSPRSLESSSASLPMIT